MGGILGRLLHEFAVVIISAILVSGVVSLTLTPMLCSRFLRPHVGERHGRMYNALERMFAKILRSYEVSLHWAMRHRLAVMAVGVLLLAATAWQFWVIPKGFLPDEEHFRSCRFRRGEPGDFIRRDEGASGKGEPDCAV